MSDSPKKLFKNTSARDKLSLNYHHDVGLLQNNAKAIELQANIRKQLGLQMPLANSKGSRSQTMSLRENIKQPKIIPSRARIGSEYNKWYIDPKLRYLKKDDNPKNNIRAYADQEYVYNNLHNQVFWDWEHPFDKGNSKTSIEMPKRLIAEQAEEVSKNKVNFRILQDFQKQLEKNRIRLPLIVQEVLNKKEKSFQ